MKNFIARILWFLMGLFLGASIVTSLASLFCVKVYRDLDKSYRPGPGRYNFIHSNYSSPQRFRHYHDINTLCTQDCPGDRYDEGRHVFEDKSIDVVTKTKTKK